MTRDEREYRIRDGRIETRRFRDEWVPSAHDDATADDIRMYEGHPVQPFLREKFGVYND